MPVLPIVDAAGGLDQFASLHVLAAMCYPRDEEMRDRFIGAVGKRMVRELIEAENRWPRTIDEEEYRLLAQGPELDDVWAKNLNAIRQRGFVAGEWLLWMLTTTMHHPEHATSGKWQHFMSEVVLPSSTQPFPKSHVSIYNFRNEFMPSAHLWAALWIFKDMGRALDPFVDDAMLLQFLSCSEEVRGEATRLRLMDGCDPGEVWAPPAALALPVGGALTPPPLPDSTVQNLSVYVSRPTREREREKQKEKERRRSKT